MSKADTLLKRATFFERMALYSDRKTFLQSVAQEEEGGYVWNQTEQSDADATRFMVGGPPATGLDEMSRKNLQQILSILQQLGVDQSITAPIGNAVVFNKVDPQAIRSAVQRAETSKASLSSGPQFKQVKDLLSQVKWPGTVMSLPTTVISRGAQKLNTLLDKYAQEGGYTWNPMEQTESDAKRFNEGGSPSMLDKASRDLLYRAMKILQDNGLTASAVGNAVVFGKVDWNAIKQEINQATLTGLSPLGKGAEISELKSILNQLSAKTPVSVAPQLEAPKPAAQATGPQIARQLIQQAKSLWAQSSDKTGNERNKALTQINAILGQLLALRKNFAKSKDLQAHLAIAGISYLFNELYGAMSYDDLMVVKNFDSGRSEGFKETA